MNGTGFRQDRDWDCPGTGMGQDKHGTGMLQGVKGKGQGQNRDRRQQRLRWGNGQDRDMTTMGQE